MPILEDIFRQHLEAFASEFFFMLVKGIVHPKMKILSSFTHPQVVPNLYEFVLPNTKEDILKKVWKQSLGHR